MELARRAIRAVPFSCVFYKHGGSATESWSRATRYWALDEMCEGTRVQELASLERLELGAVIRVVEYRSHVLASL